MSLAAGTRLGPYEIVAPSGSVRVAVGDYHDSGSYVYWYWKRPTSMFVASGLEIGR